MAQDDHSRAESERCYTAQHEWIDVDVLKNEAVFGITDYAQNQLGDVVFVDLPEIGKEVSSGDSIAVIESVKAASDIFSPIDGEIVEVNVRLHEMPELINKNPEGNGWLVIIKIRDVVDASKFLRLKMYKDLCKEFTVSET